MSRIRLLAVSAVLSVSATLGGASQVHADGGLPFGPKSRLEPRRFLSA